MTMHTITAMFRTRDEAERAAGTLRTDTSLAATNVKVLPEGGHESELKGTTDHRADSGTFLAALRNFFMPEEDRYGFAEGMRRGSYMVAADADESHTHEIVDVLEKAGAIDLDAEEARWRQEGWRGYEPSTSATAGAIGGAADGGVGGTQSSTFASHAATIPPVPGAAGTTTGTTGTMGTASARDVDEAARTPGTMTGTGRAGMAGERAAAGGTALGRDAAMAAGTEERMPLVEEQLRVGKRQVIEGRVRIRSYVVETPVTETVHLRDERVEVERRPVDRPLTGDGADPFREREIEATEMHEEPVVSKDARVREELVLHKSVKERDETVKDTVRRTEIHEDRSDDTSTRDTPTGNPAAER